MIAGARALGLTIDPAWRENVKFHLRLVLDHAARVDAFDLPDDTEPAPVFHAYMLADTLMWSGAADIAAAVTNGNVSATSVILKQRYSASGSASRCSTPSHRSSKTGRSPPRKKSISPARPANRRVHSPGCRSPPRTCSTSATW